MVDAASLELLSVVARTGSFSAAARELRMTQPGVTYQIRRLERALGAPVAVRMGRSMQLTQAGRLVLEHTQPALEQLRLADQRIAAAIGQGSGLVRLAAFPSSNATIVATALARLRHEHPEVEVRVESAEQPRAYQLVRAGDVDLALTYRFGDRGDVPAPGQSDGLRRMPLLVEKVHLLMPRDHPGAGRPVLGAQDLIADRWLVGSERFARMLRTLFAPTGATPMIRVVGDDYVAMQAFAAAGLGLILLPELAIRAHRHHSLVARTLQGWPDRELSIDFWPDQERVPAIRAVLAGLHRALGTLSLTTPTPRYAPRAADRGSGRGSGA